MGDFKRSLFGYNVRQVEEAFRTLTAELNQLKTAKEQQSKEIEDLTAQLRKVKAEEELIRDAIIDAKHLSKRLVREAKEQATEMLFEAERDISQQFVQFEQNMTSLKDMHQRIVTQKHALKQELEATIERYRDMVADVDHGGGQFDTIKEEMDTGFEQVADLTISSKQKIFLPKALQKTDETGGFDVNNLAPDSPAYAASLEADQAKSEETASRESAADEDIPVFSFQ